MSVKNFSSVQKIVLIALIILITIGLITFILPKKEIRFSASGSGCKHDVDADYDGADQCEDCNDNSEFVNPNLEETGMLCSDGIDNNCNDIKDCFEETCYSDVDDDGYYACEDCNDFRNDIYPGATELCVGNVDENCDKKIDCADELSCPSGTSTIIPGTAKVGICCSKIAIDPFSDPSNCGGCGISCSAGQLCTSDYSVPAKPVAMCTSCIGGQLCIKDDGKDKTLVDEAANVYQTLTSACMPLPYGWSAEIEIKPLIPAVCGQIIKKF